MEIVRLMKAKLGIGRSIWKPQTDSKGQGFVWGMPSHQAFCGLVGLN